MVDEFKPIDAENNVLKGKTARTLRDLVDVLAAHFSRRGLEQSAADAEASAVTKTLAQYFGGVQVYIPRGTRLKIAIRDAEIFRRFNGRNKAELAAKHDLTVRSIEIIIQSQSKLGRLGRADGSNVREVAP